MILQAADNQNRDMAPAAPSCYLPLGRTALVALSQDLSMSIHERRSKPGLGNLLPPLLPGEYAALKASIADGGYVGEAIIADQDGDIVDGFHRQRPMAAKKLFGNGRREIMTTPASTRTISLRVGATNNRTRPKAGLPRRAGHRSSQQQSRLSADRRSRNP